jgi:hypothetical protein
MTVKALPRSPLEVVETEFLTRSELDRFEQPLGTSSRSWLAQPHIGDTEQGVPFLTAA